MVEDSKESLEERLTRIERELEHQKTGLAALGVKPCSRCDIFYLRSNPGALFNCGELVCFKCIQQWWLDRSPNLSPDDRTKTESALCRWLLNHHQAELILRLSDLPSPEQLRIKLVVACESCNSEGKIFSGRKCTQCDGRGTVWVIVRGTGFEASR
ncbi:MAG TPA: hypothetical protein VN830_10000 [Verrucomicrobiae bacterium]|nr:hypothetical protein [Verrucomicrobiae bacterium]